MNTDKGKLIKAQNKIRAARGMQGINENCNYCKRSYFIGLYDFVAERLFKTVPIYSCPTCGQLI